MQTEHTSKARWNESDALQYRHVAHPNPPRPSLVSRRCSRSGCGVGNVCNGGVRRWCRLEWRGARAWRFQSRRRCARTVASCESTRDASRRRRQWRAAFWLPARCRRVRTHAGQRRSPWRSACRSRRAIAWRRVDPRGHRALQRRAQHATCIGSSVGRSPLARKFPVPQLVHKPNRRSYVKLVV